MKSVEGCVAVYGLVLNVAQSLDSRGSLRIAAGPHLNDQINVVGGPRVLDAGQLRMRVHHESADEQPPIGREVVGYLLDALEDVLANAALRSSSAAAATDWRASPNR